MKCTVLIFLLSYVLHDVVLSAPAKLTADVIYIQTENATSALFRCSAGQNHLFYLNHIVTWSRIGRDGQEVYLSQNWNLVQEGLEPGYGISSQVFNEASTKNNTSIPEMYFVLVKSRLNTNDHGEFICRLHDFDRNVMAESSVPVVVFDEGLALSPYRVVVEAGKDFAVNCMHNTSVSEGSHIVIKHVSGNGSVEVVNGAGGIDPALETKYELVTRDNGDRVIHNVLTIKASSKSDEGYVVCEMKNNNETIAQTNASITISVPVLRAIPPFYLKVPEDTVAHIQCACAIMDTAACIQNDVVWTFQNKTGDRTTIYQNGTLVEKSGMYDVMLGQNGSVVNLTVNGLKWNGEYICSLHEKESGKELTYTSVPVTVTPIGLGALALLDNYPIKIRLLCTMSGSMWENHYFDDHKLSWVHKKNGVSRTLAYNGILLPEFDSKKYSVMFDSQRFYSILTIRDVVKADYGDYVCQLSNDISQSVVMDAYLKMYGPGKITIFSSMNKPN